MAAGLANRQLWPSEVAVRSDGTLSDIQFLPTCYRNECGQLYWPPDLRGQYLKDRSEGKGLIIPSYDCGSTFVDHGSLLVSIDPLRITDELRSSRSDRS
ncbi:hypothetical protein J6590_084536 [Homalodisca vitripennis]|nr:hypothetical protein J6590_084536 [Homalodisca vitripennis]